MENHEHTSFRFVIDNFSEKEAMAVILDSPIFESGGCEWFVGVYPSNDGYHEIGHGHLSVYLFVVKPISLRSAGWKLRANFCFTVLNQSGKELTRTSDFLGVFSAESRVWGDPKVVPMAKLQEENFLENNKLIIEVQIKVGEIVDGGEVTGKGMLNFNGFDVRYTCPHQIHPMTWLFAEHPDVAVDFRPKNPMVKTAYMNVLFGLIETLNRPPQCLSETELRNAHSELSELTEAGLKLDWLETRLEEVSLERKNAIYDASQVEELKEHVKNLKLELDNEKAKSSAASAKVLLLEKAVSDLKLELDNEKAKSSTASAKVLLLEKAVSDLKLELDKERSNKSVISKVASLKDRFWN